MKGMKSHLICDCSLVVILIRKITKLKRINFSLKTIYFSLSFIHETNFTNPNYRNLFKFGFKPNIFKKIIKVFIFWHLHGRSSLGWLVCWQVSAAFPEGYNHESRKSENSNTELDTPFVLVTNLFLIVLYIHFPCHQNVFWICLLNKPGRRNFLDLQPPAGEGFHSVKRKDC